MHSLRLSWLDWWLYATGAMFLEKCDDEAKCYCLLVAGARTRMTVAGISFILWANTVLKYWDAVLCKVKLNQTHEIHMELWNAPITVLSNFSCLTLLLRFEKSLVLPYMMRPSTKLFRLRSSHLRLFARVSLCQRVPSFRFSLGDVRILTSPLRHHVLGRDQLPCHV